MRKRSLAIVVVLFVGLFLLSGCKPRTDTRSGPQYDNYHTGTKGISMNFMRDRPPDRLFHQDPSAFETFVEVRNLGTYTLGSNDLHLALGGFDRSIIPVSPSPATRLELEGKSAIFPDGSIDIAQWNPPSTIRLPDNTDLYEPTIQVTACYNYRTEAAPVICIDPDPYSAIAQDKVCSVVPVSLSGGQGAPVAVTRVEPTIFTPSSGKQAQFKIFVQNVGNGRVLNTAKSNDALQRCVSKDLNFEDFNKVAISAKMGSKQLNCKPEIINLIDGKGGFTFCTLSGVVSDTAYTTPLEVTLSYGYTESISRRVQIARTPGSS